MTVLAGISKVEDYPRLRATLAGAVQAGLCERIEVHRAADDAAEVLVLVHVASLKRAEQLLQDARYTGAFFEQAGLEEYPPLFVGDLVDVFPPESPDS